MEMTREGDLVLVYMENKPAFFARIEAITADVKPEWLQVKMLVLQVPLLVITWILREIYINGEEFTMGGRPMKMVKVVSPEVEESPEVSEEEPEASEEEPAVGKTTQDAPAAPPERGKVVSLFDRRKK